MKILNLDKRKGTVKLKTENLDDLWYISQIIDNKDIISGSTTRKIKIGDSDDRNVKIQKKKVFLKIEVEKVEFHKYGDILRVSGKIVQGPDDVQRGTYHTFSIVEDTIFSIEKERFLKFQIDKIKEASQNKRSNILICTFDREEAYFAILTNQGYELLGNFKADVTKKAVEEKRNEKIYSKIIKQITEYQKKYQSDKIIVASPAFWKDELLKEAGELKSKIITATCNSLGKNAIDEVLKRPEVASALKDDRISKELKLIEDLLAEIKKDGLHFYGLDETKKASDLGAIKMLLVTDNKIHQMRDDDSFGILDNIMKQVDMNKGNIHILNSEYDGGKKLDGLGGIGGILRFRIN